MKKRTDLTTAKSSVALLLFTLPLSSNLAYSAPSTTGEGNIVTGDHGVATGYNNAVTAKYGLAQGNDSVATGGNISRKEFDEKLFDMIKFLVPNYITEGKNQLVIGIGCTGGKHRSVSLANALAKHMQELPYSLKVEHRDIEKDAKTKGEN